MVHCNPADCVHVVILRSKCQRLSITTEELAKFWWQILMATQINNFACTCWLEHGADLTATNNEGYTALGLAVGVGNKNGKLYHRQTMVSV